MLQPVEIPRLLRLDGEMPDWVEYGRKLAAGRKARGLSQVDAAAEAGMHPQTLSEYELGKVARPSIEKLAALARMARVPLPEDAETTLERDDARRPEIDAWAKREGFEDVADELQRRLAAWDLDDEVLLFAAIKARKKPTAAKPAPAVPPTRTKITGGKRGR